MSPATRGGVSRSEPRKGATVVAAKLMFFDRDVFCVLPLNMFTRRLRLICFSNPAKSITFAAAPLYDCCI